MRKSARVIPALMFFGLLMAFSITVWGLIALTDVVSPMGSLMSLAVLACIIWLPGGIFSTLLFAHRRQQENMAKEERRDARVRAARQREIEDAQGQASVKREVMRLGRDGEVEIELPPRAAFLGDPPSGSFGGVRIWPGANCGNRARIGSPRRTQ